MCQELTDFCICVYVLGCKLGLFRLCGNDFGITAVDYITIGIIIITRMYPKVPGQYL
jgi:hypothetical protein